MQPIRHRCWQAERCHGAAAQHVLTRTSYFGTSPLLARRHRLGIDHIQTRRTAVGRLADLCSRALVAVGGARLGGADEDHQIAFVAVSHLYMYMYMDVYMYMYMYMYMKTIK